VAPHARGAPGRCRGIAVFGHRTAPAARRGGVGGIAAFGPVYRRKPVPMARSPVGPKHSHANASALRPRHRTPEASHGAHGGGMSCPPSCPPALHR
jgi:hypothetical protein